MADEHLLGATPDLARPLTGYAPALESAAVTEFNLGRCVARETAISLVINMVVATAPGLLLTSVSVAASRPVREVAADLTPQIFMAALMSGLVPCLLICRKQARGRLRVSPLTPRLRPDRAAAVAAGLAAGFTILVLAVLHVVVAPWAADGLGAGAIVGLRAGLAALAAIMVTPLALILLFGSAGKARA